MAEESMIDRNRVRFLRDTARSMREVARPQRANSMRHEMLRLAHQIDQEADDLERGFSAVALASAQDRQPRRDSDLSRRRYTGQVADFADMDVLRGPDDGGLHMRCHFVKGDCSDEFPFNICANAG